MAKDKGFTILGVSLDQPGKEEAWMTAIHKDKLTWTKVSDLKCWENEAAVLYGIRGIPAPLVLDREGKIIARASEEPNSIRSWKKSWDIKIIKSRETSSRRLHQVKTGGSHILNRNSTCMLMSSCHWADSAYQCSHQLAHNKTLYPYQNHSGEDRCLFT